MVITPLLRIAFVDIFLDLASPRPFLQPLLHARCLQDTMLGPVLSHGLILCLSDHVIVDQHLFRGHNRATLSLIGGAYGLVIY